MIENIFKLILDMSISASIVILIVLFARYLFKRKLTKTFIYALWAIVLIRLIIPFGFESQYSVFNLIQLDNLKTQSSIYTMNNDIDNIQTNNTIMQSDSFGSNNDISQKNEMLNILDETTHERFIKANIIGYFAYAWFLIRILMILYFVRLYIKTHRMIDDATLYKSNKLNDKVYISDKIDTPLLIGIVNPRIIIPSNIFITDSELDYIICHEKIHIKRMDHLIKPLSLLVLCFHWFNPLVWLSFIIAHKDMELSCDELVMIKTKDNINTDYAQSLLNLSIKQNNLFNSGLLAFGEKNIKSRVKSALSFKKPSGFIKVIGILLIVILATVLISNADINRGIANALNTPLYNDYEVQKEDIIETIRFDDETITFYKGVNNRGEYPVYMIASMVNEGFGKWRYDGGGYFNRVVDNFDEYFSTFEVISTNDRVKRIIAGFAKGSSINNIIITSDSQNIKDLNATIKHIEDDVILWYAFIDIYADDYMATFYNVKGDILHSVDKDFEKIQQVAIEKNEKFTTKGLELYVWKSPDITGNNDTYFTLLSGTERIKSNNEIYNLDVALNDINTLNSMLSEYNNVNVLHIKQMNTTDFTKDEMIALQDEIELPFSNGSTSIGLWMGYNENTGMVYITEKDKILDTCLQEIKRIRGFSIHTNDVISMVDTEFGYMVFYDRLVGGGATVYSFELISYNNEDGYKWVTGGSYGSSKLDKGIENHSFAELIEHPKGMNKGFIYGVMNAKDVTDITINKSLASSMPLIRPETIEMENGMILWYAFLPEDFGDKYEIGFWSDDNLIFSENN